MKRSGSDGARATADRRGGGEGEERLDESSCQAASTPFAERSLRAANVHPACVRTSYMRRASTTSPPASTASSLRNDDDLQWLFDAADDPTDRRGRELQRVLRRGHARSRSAPAPTRSSSPRPPVGLRRAPDLGLQRTASCRFPRAPTSASSAARPPTTSTPCARRPATGTLWVLGGGALASQFARGGQPRRADRHLRAGRARHRRRPLRAADPRPARRSRRTEELTRGCVQNVYSLNVPSRWPWTAKRSVRLAERDRRGQQDRLLEPHVGLEGVREPQRRQAARLGPHAVGDRAREAERLGDQRVQVDRVVVAGDGGVAAAEVVREAPVAVTGGSSNVRRVAGGLVAVAALEVRRRSPPRRARRPRAPR